MIELSVNINPVPSEAPAIVWSSNYPDIAEVVNGVVTAIENIAKSAGMRNRIL